MNVFERNSKKITILAFCSPNAEIAADAISDEDLVEILPRVTQILSQAVGTSDGLPYSKHDQTMSEWAAQSKGNFIWLATFTQHLHLNHFTKYGRFAKCFDDLNLITNAFYKLPIGDFTQIPNLAESKIHGFDFRYLNNPYEAYSRLLHSISSRVS